MQPEILAADWVSKRAFTMHFMLMLNHAFMIGLPLQTALLGWAWGSSILLVQAQCQITARACMLYGCSRAMYPTVKTLTHLCGKFVASIFIKRAHYHCSRQHFARALRHRWKPQSARAKNTAHTLLLRAAKLKYRPAASGCWLRTLPGRIAIQSLQATYDCGEGCKWVHCPVHAYTFV